jgi:hypothetical protein
MTHTCARGHKVLDCGLHVGFEQIGPELYVCRSGECKDVPAGPRWARRGRFRRWWRRLALALGRAMAHLRKLGYMVAMGAGDGHGAAN